MKKRGEIGFNAVIEGACREICDVGWERRKGVSVKGAERC